MVGEGTRPEKVWQIRVCFLYLPQVPRAPVTSGVPPENLEEYSVFRTSDVLCLINYIFTHTTFVEYQKDTESRDGKLDRVCTRPGGMCSTDVPDIMIEPCLPPLSFLKQCVNVLSVVHLFCLYSHNQLNGMPGNM